MTNEDKLYHLHKYFKNLIKLHDELDDGYCSFKDWLETEIQGVSRQIQTLLDPAPAQPIK